MLRMSIIGVYLFGHWFHINITHHDTKHASFFQKFFQKGQASAELVPPLNP